MVAPRLKYELFQFPSQAVNKCLGFGAELGRDGGIVCGRQQVHGSKQSV